MTDPLIAARAVHFVATTMVAGALFFTVVVVDPTLRKMGGESAVVARLRRLLAWITWSGLALALVSGAAWLALLSAEISGKPLAAMFDSNIVPTVLTQTRFGRDWQLRLALGVALTLVMVLEHRGARPSPVLAGSKAALAAGLAGSLAWAGHAGATEGTSGTIHLAADALHLIAAAAWLGALAPLAVLFAWAWRSRDAKSSAFTLAVTLRFSTLGVISVGTLLVTGIVNTWFLAGSIPAVVGTDYGHLVLSKIALFALMIGVASFNRMTLTPRLARDPLADRGRYALRQLARNSTIEIALGVLILGIVGVLGTTAPGLHVQPSWPFSVRFDPAINAPAALTAFVFALAAILALVLIITGTRLPRWITLASCLVATVVVVASLRDLAVPAFPTSYYVSPTGYTAASIARGHTLFDQSCTGCHGVDGRGDGQARKGSNAAFTDLTADHLYAHSDGDLFWWISHGIDEVMPGFAGNIDDDARWNLIDFIHANADAARLRASAKGLGYPTPDFAADCPDGTTISLRDLHGSLVHLVIAGAHSAARLQQLAHTHIAHDLATIVISREDAPENNNGPFCATRDQSVRAALAVYRGEDRADEGTEFLVDAGGQLRAIWYPGLKPAWTDDNVLRQQIGEVREAAASSRATAPHAHMQ
jgi:copper resistance protein D